MLGPFADFVIMADDESFSTAPQGLEVLYELFEHLTRGGTIENFEHPEISQPEELTAMLAVAWLDLRTFMLIKKTEGEIPE